jgi:predicted DNA-binding ribbon-helix-helix protein
LQVHHRSHTIGASLSSWCITLATTKPRVTVTLEPDVYATMKELAQLQGCSMSSLIAELLNMVHPVQQKVLDAVKTAVTTKAEARAGFLQQLEDAQSQAESSLGPLLGLLEEYANAQPPHSNTGVTPPSQDKTHPSANDLKPSK